MNQPTPNSEPTPAALNANAAPADYRGTEAYRAGLERAMTLVWEEKQKLSVMTAEYYYLKKAWEALYHEANPKGADEKH